jgi:hypothetical protein
MAQVRQLPAGVVRHNLKAGIVNRHEADSRQGYKMRD